MTTPSTADRVGRAAAVLPTRTLVLGMVHQDGRILTGELLDVADACGHSREQVRSCLRRLVAEGAFERHGSGRHAEYAATPSGLASLLAAGDRHRFAYAQDAGGTAWDGQWRMVAFAIPETQRAARDALRDQLIELGGAPIQNGLYVSPRPWVEEVTAVADELGVISAVSASTTTDLIVGGVSEPHLIAEALWDLDELGARYRSFVDMYRPVPAELEAMRDRGERLTDADFQPGALWIGAQFGECFSADPLLPPELLPQDWVGREARAVLAECRRLGMLVRADNDRSPLFQAWDDVVSSLDAS